MAEKTSFLARQTAVADALTHATNATFESWRDKSDALMDHLSRQGYSITKLAQEYQEVKPTDTTLGQEIGIGSALICGGVTIKTVIMDIPGLGSRPGLVYQFHTIDGKMLTPIVFVTPDDQSFSVVKGLTFQAVNTGIRVNAEQNNEVS